jgi:hypothetical protein
MEVTTTARATTPTFQRSRSQRDGLLDPSLVTPLAGVTSIDTLLRQALDWHTWSIEYRCVVFQHSRRGYPDRWEATCLVRRLEDSLRVRRSARSIILSLSGTQLRQPYKMSHDVRFRTTAQCSVGWPMVLN